MRRGLALSQVEGAKNGYAMVLTRMHERATGRDVSLAFHTAPYCTFAVAGGLHRVYCSHRGDTNAASDEMVPNIVYVFDGGLAFRLYEFGTMDFCNPVIEFLALAENRLKRRELLLRIPGLLDLTDLVLAADIIVVRKWLQFRLR